MSGVAIRPPAPDCTHTGLCCADLEDVAPEKVARVMAMSAANKTRLERRLMATHVLSRIGQRDREAHAWLGPRMS